MPLAAATYHQQATYWGPPSRDGFGAMTFPTPVLIACRWEEVVEDFIDKAGNQTVSAAVVYTYDLLSHDGYLARGDLTAQTNPTSVSSAYAIRRVAEIPDLRSLNFERRAYL